MLNYAATHVVLRWRATAGVFFSLTSEWGFPNASPRSFTSCQNLGKGLVHLPSFSCILPVGFPHQLLLSTFHLHRLFVGCFCFNRFVLLEMWNCYTYKMIAYKYRAEPTQRSWSGKRSRCSCSFYLHDDHGVEQALSTNFGKLLKHCVTLAMLHSAHAHRTRGNLIQEIDPKPVYFPARKHWIFPGYLPGPRQESLP